MPIDMTLAPGTVLSASSPVDSSLAGPQVNDIDIDSDEIGKLKRQSQAEVFSSMARNRHKIVV
jgi:hypothetical protein